jgi:heme-degrading monooxygenase HmoA
MLDTLQVKPDRAKDFEDVWKNRESALLETPGFIRFALLRGDEEGAHAYSINSMANDPAMRYPWSFPLTDVLKHRCTSAPR